ncbi:hypothetical protein ACFL59_00810 [Planctomycetota bacterium]
MSRSGRFGFMAVVFSLLALSCVLLGGRAIAQDAPPPPADRDFDWNAADGPEDEADPPVDSTENPADKAEDPDGAAEEDPPGPAIVREKAYYVPFEEIERVFEKTGRGIFLPYEEFLKLWEAGKPQPEKPEPEPPAPAVVRGGVYKGVVEGDVARLEVRYAIESLKKGWAELRLPLRKVAVESVKLSSEEALFVARDGAYTVYLPRPGAYEIALTVSVRVVKKPGKKTIELGIPQAAVSRLELTIPEEDIRVDIQPSLVVTQTTTEATSTRVLAFLGNAADVSVSWMPPPGKVAEEGAILFSRQAMRAYLGERILRITTEVDYEVLRGDVDTLRLSMPKDTRILSVKGDNMREWAPEGDLLTVRLHGPIKKSYKLTLSFERILDKTPDTLSVPFPRALDVLRESGWVVLGHDEGLIVRVSDTRGLSQLDPGEVPKALRRYLGVGFRYLAQPLTLDLSIEKITPLVRSQTISVVTLGREEDQWFGWIDYAIKKAGLFRLSFRVPKSWNVETVGDPGTVEEFQTTEKEGRKTVTVSLKSKALGGFRLPFRLSREGTAKRSELTLSPPEVLLVEQDRGLFGVSAPRDRDVGTESLSHMIDADVDELFRTGIMNQISSEAAMPRTFRYREQPASVELTLKDKKTEIDVLAQHLVEVADGEIRITHLLDYNVQYAPVESLSFRAESALDDKLKVEAKQKTEVVKEPGPEGTTLWTVKFQPPVLGALTLTLTHTIELQGLESGKPFSHSVPLAHATAIRGVQGFVAIRKEGTLEILPQTEGMEAMDASDLPDKLRRGQIYSTFRYFTASPTLTLQLTRYDYERLATTVVQLQRLKSVLSEESRLKTQATLFVQNTDRQYLEVQLSREARIFSLSVDGRPQSPKKRKQGAGTLIQIPRSAGTGGTFPVVLVYEERLSKHDMTSLGSVKLETLRVLDDVPVSKIELELYLPPEYVYMGWDGNLYRRRWARPGLWSRFKSLVGGGAAQGTIDRRRRQPASTTGAGAVLVDVPTEGYRRYIFDTLAPRAKLQFVYVGVKLYWFLDVLIFAAAVVGGYLALTRVFTSKLVGGAGLVFLGFSLVWLTTGPTAILCSSFLVGVLGACVILMWKSLVSFWHKRRTVRLDLVADPYLEEAPTKASSTAAPAAEKQSSATEEAKKAGDKKPDAESPGAPAAEKGAGEASGQASASTGGEEPESGTRPSADQDPEDSGQSGEKEER